MRLAQASNIVSKVAVQVVHASTISICQFTSNLVVLPSGSGILLYTKQDTQYQETAMTIRIEHANMIVRNVDATARFLQTAFPEFAVRREGSTEAGRWMHIGTEDTYLALNEASSEPPESWVPYAGKPGVNHLGYEVDDAKALRERMRGAGYTDSTVPNME
jgi:hypothetical protein